MQNSELSIIIPVYNGERFLKKTLDSVLYQTFKNFQLILVDDGSTDRTSDICEMYAKRDKRVRVLHQKNAGMSEARYQGYLLAKESSWIMFLDADDIFDRNMFRDLMSHREGQDIIYVLFQNMTEKQMHQWQWKELQGMEAVTGMEALERVYQKKEQMPGEVSRLWGMLISPDYMKKMEKIFLPVRDVLPQNYLNDVFCMPRFLVNTRNVVQLNKVYILHRISKYSDSRLLKPNALHYELADASSMNVDYLRQVNCRIAYEKELIGLYLVILKIWYQTVTKEDNPEIKKMYMDKVKIYYKKYYKEFVNVRCEGKSEKVVKFTIWLFGKSPLIWKLLVGNIRYGLMYRIQH